MRKKYVSRIVSGVALATALLLPRDGSAALVTGKVKAEVYGNNGGGTTIAALTSDPNYPAKPSEVYYVNDLEFPDKDNFGDGLVPRGDIFNNYGLRISGYITPTQAGQYVFFLAADDNAEFYLSTDATPANAKLLAFEPQWNPVRAFLAVDRRVCAAAPDANGVTKCENVSVPVTLAANQRYYFYGLMKEGGGGDNYAVAWTRLPEVPTDPTTMVPIPSQFLSVDAPAAPTITSQPQNEAVIAGFPAGFSVGLDIPPSVTVNSIQWSKNGTPIPDSNTNSISIVTTAADDGAKFRVVITTSNGTLTSDEATLVVAALANEFAAGVVKAEFFTGITGTAVDGLTSSEAYINNTPNDVRLLGAIDSPNGYGDNYGVRISGFVIPPANGDYRFFTRSDDASQLWLSPDSNPANAVMIAEETGCCDGFLAPGAPETSEPVTMVANTRYAFYYLMKEGGGGDFAQVAVRNETDTTPPASLTPLTGAWIGANAKISKGDITITTQPTGGSVEEARPINLRVAATTTPAEFNLPLLVQWQKNGVNIPGATATTFTIPTAVLADAGTYRAVLNVAGVKSTNSADAVIAVTVDTNGPLLTGGGAVKKGATTEIGLAFDEKLDPATVVASAFTLSKGTISSARYVVQASSAVLVVAGVVPGDAISVTATGIKDLKGNTRATTSANVTVPAAARLLTWVGVGGDALVLDARGGAKFADDVVARSEKDFDLISGGSQHWTGYDEETFVYEEITGDFDKVVRVEYQDPVTQWSRAGLDAREALDDGKTQDDITAGYKFSQHFTVRVNPPAVMGWDGRIGNNLHEVIHRPVEGANYDGFNAMFNILGGANAAPTYPNAWIRLKREGQRLTAFMSSNGTAWTPIGNVTYQDDADSPENEVLADKLFVGMFYGPEFVNIAEDLRFNNAASIAKFRDYGNFSTGPAPGGPPVITVTKSGNSLTIAWTEGGTLQGSASLTGPWTDVSSTTPHTATINLTERTRFYRVTKPN